MRNFAFYLAFGAAAFVYGLVFDSETPVSAAQPASLAIATTSSAYSTAVVAKGGVKPYTYSAAGLPAGLTK